MIATQRFLFVHLHKTGGQFVNRVLLRYLPDAHAIGYHLPRSAAPPELRALPVIGFVRNPWDWYVSWYAFNLAQPQRNPIFRAVSTDGRLDFKHTLINMLHLGCERSRVLRTRIGAALPETREGNLGSGITRADLLGYEDESRGYFTWLWRYMFFLGRRADSLHAGRMENLRMDLLDALRAVGQPVTSELHDAVLNNPPVNTSARRDYRTCYDAELRALVAARDAELVGTYGYSF
ncbi:MAG TPA: hypothetical protein VJS89_07560 [Gammaproteobacteria bacterium]|nr:hypothetical protein [Gammaproteobacteria bacterium]